jgi:glutamyl-tRNA synthetase
MPAEELAPRLVPFLHAAGLNTDEEKVRRVAPLIRERIRLLTDAVAVADFFFVDELPPYDASELIPQKGDAATALRALERAREVLADVDFTHQALEAALRAAAAGAGMKTGQMFQPIRVAVCGRKNAPPLFETIEVIGRETCLKRIGRAIARLRDNGNV